MSRRAGQLRGYGATALLLTMATAIGGIVALCDWLVPEGTATQQLEAPAEEDRTPGQVGCPTTFREPVEVTSSELFDCPRLYDGALVHYRGEAIAGVLRRGERAWVHLNDDAYALESGPLAEHRTALGGNAGIAVSLPIAVADAITHTGGAAAQGDILDVTGRFQRADVTDGGGPTIQAEHARIESVGRPLRRQVTPRLAITAAVLALGASGTLAGLLRSRRRAWR